jgi:hypothetical protein
MGRIEIYVSAIEVLYSKSEVIIYSTLTFNPIF